MPRKKTLTLTNAEHRIMEVIWAKGSATVADVVEALNGKDAYTTILTLMTILKGKGYLSSAKRDALLFSCPGLIGDTAARKAVHQLLAKFFAGSASELVLSFLREEELTPQELECDQEKRSRLRRRIAMETEILLASDRLLATVMNGIYQGIPRHGPGGVELSCVQPNQMPPLVTRYGFATLVLLVCSSWHIVFFFQVLPRSNRERSLDRSDARARD